MGTLIGKRALVTGGAQGIGKAITEALLAAGCDVAIHYHSSADGARQLAATADRLGRRLSAFAADLTVESAAADMVATAVDGTACCGRRRRPTGASAPISARESGFSWMSERGHSTVNGWHRRLQGTAGCGTMAPSGRKRRRSIRRSKHGRRDQPLRDGDAALLGVTVLRP